MSKYIPGNQKHLTLDDRIYPDVSDEQMCQWEASKALECMTLNGEKRYFRNAAPNLFRVDSVCYQIKAAKDGVSFSGSEKVNMENLPEIIASVKKSGNPITAPKRMRITYTLTVDSNATAMAGFIGVNMGYGAIGVWIAMVLDWIFRVICFVSRYLSGHWLKTAGLKDNR